MLLNNRKVTFIFRCPRTGFDVQGWSDGVFEASLAYETVNCTVCQMVHLVDPKTGYVLGSDNDE